LRANRGAIAVGGGEKGKVDARHGTVAIRLARVRSMPNQFDETCHHKVAKASVPLRPGTILHSGIETARDELPYG
jgi:hypothetical protein